MCANKNIANKFDALKIAFLLATVKSRVNIEISDVALYFHHSCSFADTIVGSLFLHVQNHAFV
jgi:hypothetical protein